MKLHSMRVRNFRCFKNETEIIFDDLTALIGKNDAGKSSIMEALDIFLNDGKPDQHDAAKGGNAKDLTIICEFSDLPEQVLIDETNPTSLDAELLLNQSGRLEIHKTYSGQLATPKLEAVSAMAVHPTAKGAADLLQLRNSELKQRAKELGVDLSTVDQTVNAQIRERIRSHVGEVASKAWLIPLGDDNARKVWDRLKIYLPLFALFKSDRASTDQDPEAQDPLKVAVKEAIKAKQAELDSIAAHVEAEVKKLASATLAKLREMDPTLAARLTPQFSPPRWETLFKASFTGDDEIPVNKRGSGVKRLILLSFFRAKAEQRLSESDRNEVIYGIEEPETGQHPNNQRMLLRALYICA